MHMISIMLAGLRKMVDGIEDCTMEDQIVPQFGTNSCPPVSSSLCCICRMRLLPIMINRGSWVLRRSTRNQGTLEECVVGADWRLRGKTATRPRFRVSLAPRNILDDLLVVAL